jgi:hypothetical protein
VEGQGVVDQGRHRRRRPRWPQTLTNHRLHLRVDCGQRDPRRRRESRTEGRSHAGRPVLPDGSTGTDPLEADLNGPMVILPWVGSTTQGSTRPILILPASTKKKKKTCRPTKIATEAPPSTSRRALSFRLAFLATPETATNPAPRGNGRPPRRLRVRRRGSVLDRVPALLLRALIPASLPWAPPPLPDHGLPPRLPRRRAPRGAAYRPWR